MKKIFIKLLKEFCRAGLAAVLTTLGICSASGCVYFS